MAEKWSKKNYFDNRIISELNLIMYAFVLHVTKMTIDEKDTHTFAYTLQETIMVCIWFKHILFR